MLMLVVNGRHEMFSLQVTYVNLYRLIVILLYIFPMKNDVLIMLGKYKDSQFLLMTFSWESGIKSSIQNILLQIEVFRNSIFFKKKKSFWRTCVLFWGHWYPCFGFLVTSPSGFKARVGCLICIAEVNVMYIS